MPFFRSFVVATITPVHAFVFRRSIESEFTASGYEVSAFKAMSAST